MPSSPHLAAAAPRYRLRASAFAAIALLGGVVILALRPDDDGAVRQPAPRSKPAAVAIPTQQGAVIAAVAYLNALGWQVLVDAEARRRAIAQRAVPEVAADLEAQLAAPAESVRAAVTRGPVLARSAILGYRVDRFEGRAARVSLWGMALFGSGAYPTATQWSTSHIRLVWRRDRWLVAGVQSRGGPSPDSPLRSLMRAARGYRELRHAP